MRPTNDELQAYVGGQMEVQNQSEHYLLRGEIETITLEGEELTVRFRWLARRGGEKCAPPVYGSKWVADSNLSYALNVMEGATDFAKRKGGPEDPEDRIIIESWISSELIVLYHSTEAKKLDPANVEGLTVSA